MKLQIFIILGLFISLTLQIKRTSDEDIYGQHLRVSAFQPFHVAILKLIYTMILACKLAISII
jgi:hypothetical protein